MDLVLLLIAVILFGLAAFGVAVLWRIQVLAAGLFFLALALLWPHLAVGLH